MKKKVLIIKLGLVELLDYQYDKSIALGDVFRCTTLLHAFSNCHVTWLTDGRAFPLLENNPFIYRLLHYDLTTVLQLQAEEFDVVVNMEKVPGLCAFTDSLKAWQKFGFRYNASSGEVAAYIGAEQVLEFSQNSSLKRECKSKNFSEFLFSIIGRKWQGEEYILGYKPTSKIAYDVGFNFQIGLKWPQKAWPEAYWPILEESLVAGGYTISYQSGQTNIHDYIEWLHSCRLIVTNDSLGLHLGLALDKFIVALFGPTYESEVYVPESQGIKLLPEVERECIPCMRPVCCHNDPCMGHISPGSVFREIEKFLSGSTGG